MRGSKLFLSIIFGIAVITAITVFYLYNTLSYKNVNIFSSIPERTVVSILKVKSFNNLKNTLTDSSSSRNGLFNNFLLHRSDEIFRNLESSLIPLHEVSSELIEFNNRSFLISVHLSKDSSLQFLYTFSIKNRKEGNLIFEHLKSQNTVIKERGEIEIYNFTATNNYPLYFRVDKGVLTFSYSKSLLLESIKQQSSKESILDNNQLRSLVEISKNSDFDNLYINTNLLRDIGIKVLSKDWQDYLALLQNNELWTQYDIDYKQTKLNLNGVYFCQSTSDFLNNTKPSHCSLDSVYSSDITSFLNYSFEKSSFDASFRSSLIKDGSSISTNVQSLCSVIEPEFGVAQFKSDSIGSVRRALFQKVSNSDKVFKKFQSGISVVENWNIDSKLNLDIYRVNNSNDLTSIYKSFFKSIPTDYFISFDTYLVVANDIALLKKIYLDYILGNTLANNKIYKEYRHNFPDTENIFIYSICKSGSFMSRFHEKSTSNSQVDNIFGAQLTYSDSIAYTSIVVDYDVKIRDFSTAKWISYLDTIVSSEPQVVIHPVDEAQCILVQDASHQLYLLNAIGRILWKRPLDGRIMGSIQQFTIKGKNQNLILFNTANKIYQINFDGNNIGNFPVLLPSDATASLSIFDYDQNGDYRLFVPSKDKSIRVYDNKGNLVTGFQSSPLLGEICSPIQHFTASDKDYIVLDDGYASRILDRRGNDRIKLDKEFDKSSDTPFFLVTEEKQFFLVTSSNEGDIIKIGIPDGKVNKINGLENSDNPVMFPIYVKKNIINYLFIDKGRIKLVSSKGDKIYENKLDVHDLFNVKLFGDLRSGFFISFLDRSSSLLYVYRVDNGRLISGFPKYGELNYTLKYHNDGSLQIYSGTNYSTIISY